MTVSRLDQIPPHRIIDIGIAHVPEGRQLFPEMTVLENLELGSLRGPAKAQRKETLEWVLSLFPRLQERRKQLAGTMSGGEQQMCAIARGLMSRPKMVLFDEPSLGLSPLLTQEIFQLAQTVHKEGLTILMVEQNVKQTLAICDRAYVLENGRISWKAKARSCWKTKRSNRLFWASDARVTSLRISPSVPRKSSKPDEYLRGIVFCVVCGLS